MNSFENIVALCLLCIAISANAELPSYRSKYVGEETRQIKTLSREDIDELRNGGGWGLAKAAELNGYPGPAHLLAMQQKIHLSDDQKKSVRNIYQEMHTAATATGGKLIQLEQQLNDAFAKRTINQTTLEQLIRDIASVRAELRIIHLSAHLRTAALLSADQIKQYNTLRGYDGDSGVAPCEQVPQGHDAAMWKRHHGCEQTTD